jgi:uncharacterized protein (DUF2235 family)
MENKSIVLCFDGTWNTPGTTAAYVEDDSTNVFRFYERVQAENARGQKQIKWYNEGVGTEWFNRFRGGAFGLQLDQHILDGYLYLIKNYEEGDEIYLIGFSRGAYTARSLAGLIRNSGLLKNADEELINRAYGIYRSKEDVDSEHALAFRNANSRDISIKFIGVWDTVGALGVPLKPFAEFNAEHYGFHDTKLSSIIQNAYHAVAVDEHREPYAATLWQPQDQQDREKGQKLEQLWFSGAHADVGGGYPGTHPIADLTLRWMQKKASDCGLGVVIIPPPQESDLLSVDLHDSFTEFLGGFFTWFSHRHYRPIGQLEDGPQSLDLSVRKRYSSRTNYRPKNRGLFEVLGPPVSMVESSAAW